MFKTLNLTNPDGIVISASIYYNRGYFYLDVYTKYNEIGNSDGVTLIYKTLHGAKIGFGVRYNFKAKWE